MLLTTSDGGTTRVARWAEELRAFLSGEPKREVRQKILDNHHKMEELIRLIQQESDSQERDLHEPRH